MAVKQDTIVRTDIGTTGYARSVDFVSRFGRTWAGIRDILGISNPIAKVPGQAIIAYNATVSLDASPAEGDEIPYSKVQLTPVVQDIAEIGKYCKGVSIEAVNSYGAAVAIEKTDDAFLNELTGRVLNTFYTDLQGISTTTTGTGTAMQDSIAQAIGLARAEAERVGRDTSDMVVFVNTLDFYTYLGTAPITIQSEFGLTYIENFMGASKVILSPYITAGSVYATPASNLNFFYIDPAASDFARMDLNYITDGITNLIGFATVGNYNHAVGECFAITGCKLFPELVNAVSKITF